MNIFYCWSSLIHLYEYNFNSFHISDINKRISTIFYFESFIAWVYFHDMSDEETTGKYFLFLVHPNHTKMEEIKQQRV